ncbi:hypothetical protein BKA82DRAFT_541329 [Pisolithus tinctorius]|uniref:Uncharacterized protein n=1 Tax=Pisolithus tinctorius Marx 270 TaxID=870435 RepID=A0A0C3PAZ3_PISTI|nr:hypothetical protein BKA82DRAFT_541329 [Pisolithus tinctorius]KIO04814.1 hypothetical protein M404DRAFT_541329 [Pisolithus tinctorius Marx 270]
MLFRCRTLGLHESRKFIIISLWMIYHVYDMPYTNALLRFSSVSPLMRTVPFGLTVASKIPAGYPNRWRSLDFAQSLSAARQREHDR